MRATLKPVFTTAMQKTFCLRGAGRFSWPTDGAASEIFNLCRTATGRAADHVQFYLPCKTATRAPEERRGRGRGRKKKGKAWRGTQEGGERRENFFLVRSCSRIYSGDISPAIPELRKRIKIETRRHVFLFKKRNVSRVSLLPRRNYTDDRTRDISSSRRLIFIPKSRGYVFLSASQTKKGVTSVKLPRLFGI